MRKHLLFAMIVIIASFNKHSLAQTSNYELEEIGNWKIYSFVDPFEDFVTPVLVLNLSNKEYLLLKCDTPNANPYASIKTDIYMGSEDTTLITYRIDKNEPQRIEGKPDGSSVHIFSESATALFISDLLKTTQNKLAVKVFGYDEFYTAIYSVEGIQDAIPVLTKFCKQTW